MKLSIKGGSTTPDTKASTLPAISRLPSTVRHRKGVLSLDFSPERRLGQVTKRENLLQSAEYLISTCKASATPTPPLTLRRVEADIRSTLAAIKAVGHKEVIRFRKKFLEEEVHYSRLAVTRMMELNRRQLKRARYDLT
jgi:hypothetical protein